MKKIVIIIVIAAAVIGVGIWLLIPRTEKWDTTVRCYDLNEVDFSLSDDTSLEGGIDFECDFEVVHSLVFGTQIDGTAKWDGIEYKITSKNFHSGNDWIGAVVSIEAPPIYMFVSPDKNHVMLQDTEKKGSGYWVEAKENIGELKEACRAFGLNYMFE